jgi:hypothetical protein
MLYFVFSPRVIMILVAHSLESGARPLLFLSKVATRACAWRCARGACRLACAAHMYLL